MRTLVCYLVVLAATSLAVGQDLGKTFKYKKSELAGKSITAGTTDVILVVEEVKPKEVKTIITNSDNPHVKVRAVEMDGDVRIVITGDKKGKAKVSWGFSTTTGGDGGYKDLKVEIK